MERTLDYLTLMAHRTAGVPSDTASATSGSSPSRGHVRQASPPTAELESEAAVPERDPQPADGINAALGTSHGTANERVKAVFNLPHDDLLHYCLKYQFELENLLAFPDMHEEADISVAATPAEMDSRPLLDYRRVRQLQQDRASSASLSLLTPLLSSTATVAVLVPLGLRK